MGEVIAMPQTKLDKLRVQNASGLSEVRAGTKVVNKEVENRVRAENLAASESNFDGAA